MMHRPAAGRAGLDANAEDSLEALRPHYRGAPPRRMQGKSGQLADFVIEWLITRRHRLQREDLAALWRCDT